MLGASVSRGLEDRVRAATEHDAGDAAGHRPPRDRRVPGEQAERAAIVRQHVGAELMDAALLSRTKDLLEEERAETESLPAVGHDETDVGGGRFIRRAVPRHTDELGLLPVVDFGDDRHPLAIVDVGEGVRLLGEEPSEREESLVHRPWAQATAQRDQTRLVVGTDRADAHGGAVAQDHALFRVGQVSWGLDSHANAVSGLTFISVTRPSEASASSSRTGAIARHGPHHSAQKSTITRPWVATSASSKFRSVRWIVSANP